MIDSISNAQVKNIMQLQKKSRVRNEQHLFVAEGVKMVAEDTDRPVLKRYILPSPLIRRKVWPRFPAAGCLRGWPRYLRKRSVTGCLRNCPRHRLPRE